MKKFIISLYTFLFGATLWALPVGNPSDASLLCDGWLWEGNCAHPCDPSLHFCHGLRVRVGFYGDYVFNRHLKTTKPSRRVIDHVKINTNAAFLALNLWDRWDLFTTLGATYFSIDANPRIFNITLATPLFAIETQTRFSWSVGSRYTLWECGSTHFGVEGQYFSTHPEVKYVRQVIVGNPHLSSHYHEWQLGIGVSHRIHLFVPYLAFKWSQARLNTGQPNILLTDGPLGSNFTFFNLTNQKHWGWALGLSIVDCEKSSLTVEGRFADERALYVNGQIRF